MSLKVIVFATILVGVLGFPGAHDSTYKFNYHVQDEESDINFGHKETRVGDNTEGLYHVLLPDGRFKKVTYEVNGDSGFVADVTYGDHYPGLYGK